MVDTRYIDLKSISDDVRYKVFDYLWNVRRVGSRSLGISPSLANMVKNRKRRVTDDLLKRMLELLTPDEYAELVEGVSLVKVDPDTFVKILSSAITDPVLKPVLVEFVRTRLASEIFAEASRYTVTKDDLVEFRKVLERKVKVRERGARGGIVRDTANKHWKYINELLTYLGYSFTVERLEDLTEELIEEFGVAKARHMIKALRVFTKTIIRKKDRGLATRILDVVKVPKENMEPLIQRILLGKERVPTIEEIRKLVNAIEHMGAKLAVILLAETGLRPIEIFGLTMNSVDIDRRIIYPGHLSATKRAYIAFITKKTQEFIKNEYLEWREWYLDQYEHAVKNIGRDINKWRQKLIPTSEATIRAEIKLASKKTGIYIKPYDLRKFFISHMLLNKVPGEILAVMTGQANMSRIEVIVRHYFGGSIERLREFYDGHAPQILP